MNKRTSEERSEFLRKVMRAMFGDPWLWLMLVAVLSVFGLALLYGDGPNAILAGIREDIEKDSPIAFVALGIALVGGFAAFGTVFNSLVKFLQVPLDLSKQRDSLQEELKRQAERVTELDRRVKVTLDDVVGIALTRAGEAPRESLSDSLKEELREEVLQGASKSVLAIIDKEVEKRAQKIPLAAASRLLEDTRMRLATEVAALTRRATLNLVLGAMTTGLALLVLWIFVSRAVVQVEQPLSFLAYFIPRVTLVLFIQVFAFFFLRMYKATLPEIKYFQNELTNHEARATALWFALNQCPEKAGDCVTSLLGTERNHVLSKGQTTVEIEKARLSATERDNLLEKVISIIKVKA